MRCSTCFKAPAAIDNLAQEPYLRTTRASLLLDFPLPARRLLAWRGKLNVRE